MSEQGFGDPPETPPGGPATPPPNAWQTINPTPTPPPGYTPPPAGQYPPPPGYPPPGYGQPAVAGMSRNSAAALAYVTFIPAIIFLIMAPYSKDRFIRFHAWQCILLTGVWILMSVMFIFFAIMGMFGMFFIFHTIYWLLRLGLFILWLVAIIQASKGAWFKIPVVGDIAMSLAGKENI